MKKVLSIFLLLLSVAIGAWAGDVNATLDHTAGAQWGSNTGASTVDAEKEHYNNDAANSWAGCAYAKFTFSIPEGHSISKATLTYSVNQGGRSGRNDIIYYMKKDFDIDWTTFAGQTATDLRNTGSRDGKAVEAAATGGTGDRIGLSQDVTTAVKAIYEAGQSYIIFQWTGNAGGADLYGKASENAPTLVITTTNETLYEATFIANEGAISPTITVYSDADRTTPIAKNSLQANTTYYYTATLTGYSDYKGDFAVETSNPTVNFTMTAKSVFKYTVNAVDGSGNALGTVNSGSGYEGDAVTFYYPEFVLSGTTLYVKNKNGGNPYWGASGTLDADNKEFSVTYGDGTIEDVVFYKEAEAIEGFTPKTTNNATIRCSNGTGGIVAEDVVLTTLAPGKYKIFGQVWGTTGVTAGVKAGEKELWSLESTGSLVNSTSDEFEITESTDLTVYTTGGNDNHMLDLLYIVKTGEYVPVVTSYAVTISNEIENGTVVADPTSAKAGDEVTLTNTPAEGYEFVSYSVTCKTNNEAVIVTDGKFTMPADDVTVSATFKKKPIYIETDLTAQFNSLATTKWEGSSGQVGWAAPEVTTNSGLKVAAWERYNGSCDLDGDIMYSTVTGLTPGTYKIELYGAAAFTFGRGFGSMDFTGDFSKDTSDTYKENDAITENTGVTLYAETSEGKVANEIPIWYATNFNTSGIATATLDNVIVGAEGTIKIGLSKTSKSTNWHVVQLKGVTAQVNAIELHANTVAAANAALSAEENAVVVGEERTALETAIANNSKVAEETADAYKAAIEALETATSAFTSAREPYAALASTKESVAGYVEKYVYASAEKISAVRTIAEAVPTSAADATSKNESLTTALRAMAESHTKAESIEGAAIVEITNPSAEDGTNGWTVVKGEGSEGNVDVKSNEPWTSADGIAEHKYFDGGNWGASAWDVSLTQDVELSAGKYLLSAIGRASGDVALTLFAGENKAAMPAIGASDGLFNRGWNYTSVEFEVDTKSTVTIGVQGVTSVVHNWMSFSDFKLILLEAIPEYSITVAQPENGTVEVAPTLAKVGEEVTITATPAEGYELASISVTGVKTNEAVIVTDGKFKMPADDVTVSATFVLITGIDNASATANGTLPDGKYFIKGKLTIIKGGNKFGAAGVAK